MKRDEALVFAEKEWNYCEKNQLQHLFILDENYPRRLKQCQDAPIMLYFKGTCDLNQKKIISIVGTRNETNYGQKILEELVSAFAHKNILVVSGLAYGVDIRAHRLCLENNIETVAVLGHGLDRIYPSSHRSTASKMIQNGGLLTEFPSNTNPDRENFPMRNRIIAGLSDATIVIESKESGGSMITADLANSYDREVCAFPGRATDEYSLGCNELIKTNRAHLVTHAADVASLLAWDITSSTQKRVSRINWADRSVDEQRLLAILAENLAIQVDELVLSTGFSQSKLSLVLLDLQMDGVVQILPGNRCMLV
jgi:DNA processing protein